MTNQSTKAAAKALMEQMSPDVLDANRKVLAMLMTTTTDVLDAAIRLQGAVAQPAASEPAGAASTLAVRFESLWRILRGPELQREYRFHPVRKWRLDYYHAPTRTAIEIEGGLYGGGRHVRSRGYLGDIDKYNAAAMLGITVLRLGTGQVDSERVKEFIDYIARKEVQP